MVSKILDRQQPSLWQWANTVIFENHDFSMSFGVWKDVIVMSR